MYTFLYHCLCSKMMITAHPTLWKRETHYSQTILSRSSRFSLQFSLFRSSTNLSFKEHFFTNKTIREQQNWVAHKITFCFPSLSPTHWITSSKSLPKSFFIPNPSLLRPAATRDRDTGCERWTGLMLWWPCSWIIKIQIPRDTGMCPSPGSV